MDSQLIDSEWHGLPLTFFILMAPYLPLKSFCVLATVCTNWRDCVERVIQLPSFWQNMTLKEGSFKNSPPLFAKGLQVFGKQVCSLQIGPHITEGTVFIFLKSLECSIFMGLTNFPKLKTFTLKYPKPDHREIIFEHTAKSHILDSVLRQLSGLNSLSLQDLNLSTFDACKAIQSCALSNSNTLRYLDFTNLSAPQETFYFVDLQHFLNLKHLRISVSQISRSLLDELAESTITKLELVGSDVNAPTPLNIGRQRWKKLVSKEPPMEITFEQEEGTHFLNLPSEKCPLAKIVLHDTQYEMSEDDYLWITKPILERQAIDPTFLVEFRQTGLSQVCRALDRPWQDRSDWHLVALVQICPNLRVLQFRDVVSSLTVLLIARIAAKLSTLRFRKQAIKMTADWSYIILFQLHLDDSALMPLILAATNTDKMCSTVSACLSQNWMPLSDIEFGKF